MITPALSILVRVRTDPPLRSQIRALKPLIEKHDHPSLPLLRDVLKEFRDDELEHLDTAVEEGAQKAPGHSLLSAVIGAGCKAAIKVCEKI
jgi:ubiquinone biosynthesis monooxygenase Coq7